jgi:MFS family permease
VRVVFASNGMLFATWASRIPAVRDDLHADERGLGFALLFIAVGSLLAMPFSGRLVAGVGARALLVACIVSCCLAYPALRTSWCCPPRCSSSAPGAASGTWR